MTAISETQRRTAATSILLVATLGAIYMVSQLLRNSIGVIAPNIADEMRMPASEIGILSSAFFLAFAATQIPLGVAIDRYGPKRCMLVCAGVVVAGALLFAFGRTPIELIAARVLMGVGTSCYLMAPLALYARLFAPERFATLVGMQLSLGTVGTLLATAPLAYAVAGIGWRASFVIIAAIMAVIALATAVVVREPPPTDSHHESFRQSLAGIREAFLTPSVGRLFVMNMVTYSSFVMFVGLWGGPYLTHVYGYDLKARGLLLLIPAVTQVLGMMAYGSSERLAGRYRTPVVCGAVVTAGLMIALAALGPLPQPALIAWLAAFGACSAWMPVLIAQGKSLFPPRLIGRGLTLLNMGSMSGVFAVQTVSGFAIDLFPATDGVYPATAYAVVFALQAGLVLAALLNYLPARDPLAEKRRAEEVSR